ncbi:MAG: hypothetical protein RIF41_13780, partial [Polyangiaceae bacterium]
MKRTLLTIACATLLWGGIACGDDGGDGAGGGGDGGASTGTQTGTAGGGEGGNGGAGGSSCTGTGDLMFGDSCQCDDQCESGLCFAFGMGSRCTIPCPTDPADCPNMGEG